MTNSTPAIPLSHTIPWGQCLRCGKALGACLCPPADPPPPVPTGWRCPACSRVWGPAVTECVPCRPKGLA